MKPLLCYFTLAYLLSWMIWLPLYGPSFGIHGLPVLPFHHGLGGLGPLISALVTTAIFEEKKGLKRLLQQLFQFKPVPYLLIAFFSPFLLASVALIGSFFIFHTPLDFTALSRSNEFPEYNFAALLLYNVFFFGLGEEAGWRGFALPRFQQRFSAFNSALILTVFWAVWHWPAFFYRPGYASMNMAGVIGWAVSLLTGSILLTWLYNVSKGSVLICAVFHATIDIAFTAENAGPETTHLMGMLITLWGILTIFTLRTKKAAPG